MAPKSKESPFMRLFASDSTGSLQKIRDQIYAHVWSRERRDDFKLDWVVTEHGFNRNVPERYIQETSYGSVALQCVKAMPCWLLLANKRISADFVRFIYSANDLEIDVDLKAINTEENEGKLQHIVSLLQNPNFKHYTRSARIRIHFPHEYAIQGLPAFNQHALEDVAATLDEFERLDHLAVRIVPSQSPSDYELRLAAFPFYRLRMVHWSIRLLNPMTLKWDKVETQQMHLLDKAWELFLVTGSLTVPVNAGVVEKQSVNAGQVSVNKVVVNLPANQPTNQQKNGSQKKKGRKKKATAAVAITASNSTTNSAAASDAEQSRPSTPTSVPTGDPSVPRPADVEPADDSISSKAESCRPEPSDPELPATSAVGPPSPPLSPSKLQQAEEQAEKSVSGSVDEPVMTPAESSVASDENDQPLATQMAVETLAEADTNESVDLQKHEICRPPSPAPSSATLDSIPMEDGIPTMTEEASDVATCVTEEAEVNKLEPEKKKRKPRKKSKKSKPANSVEAQADAGLVQCESDGVDSDFVQTHLLDLVSLLNLSSPLLTISLGSSDVNLSEAELSPCAIDGFAACTDPRTGQVTLIPRTQEVNRHLRQKERVVASQPERQAERAKTREKRQAKKIKEARLRRKDASLPSRPSTGTNWRPSEDKSQHVIQRHGRGSPKLSEDNLLRRLMEMGSEITDCSRGSGMQVPSIGTEGFAHGEDISDDDEYSPEYSLPDDCAMPSSQPAAMGPPPRPRARDTNNEQQKDCVQKVPAGDEEFRIKRQEQQSELERGMTALGSDYADMAAPINDQWTSTKADKPGQRTISEAMQWRCGSNNVHNPACLSDLVFAGGDMDRDRAIKEVDEEVDASPRDSDSVDGQFGDEQTLFNE